MRTRANMGRSYLGVPSLILLIVGASTMSIASVVHSPDAYLYGVYSLGAALVLYLVGEVVNFRRARARALVQMIDRERDFSSAIPPLD